MMLGQRTTNDTDATEENWERSVLMLRDRWVMCNMSRLPGWQGMAYAGSKRQHTTGMICIGSQLDNEAEILTGG